MLAKIASAIAANEEASASEIKAAMQQEISVNLMRSIAKAIGRRRRDGGSATNANAADRRRREAMDLEFDEVTFQ